MTIRHKRHTSHRPGLCLIAEKSVLGCQPGTCLYLLVLYKASVHIPMHSGMVRLHLRHLLKYAV